MKTAKLILACTLALAGTAGYAQTQPAKQAAPKPVTTATKPAATTTAKPAQNTTAAAGAYEKVTTVEGITEYRLKNGLRVLIFPDPSKDVMTVNVTYLVGSRMEGYGETGMAHLLEHMVFKGSTHHTNVPQELSSHGAQPNGSTDYDRTNYFETFSATDENLKWALDMESDRMVNSFIAKKDLESEFSVVRNEFESGENYPAGVLLERVMSTAYLWHNYGKATIGSKEDIEKVPVDNLKAFYKKFYQPDNAVLTVAGKLDEAKTIALVNQYFGVLPRPTRKIEEPYTIEPTQDGERVVELSRVGDAQNVSCGYHIPAGSHPDFAAVNVLTEVLANEPSGRIYKALVETKKGSAEWGFSFETKDPGFSYFNVDVLKEKSVADARAALLNVFDSLPYQPVTNEEVERAKNKLIKDIELLYNNSTRVGLAMSEYIAQGDWRLFFIARDRIEKVTADDVNRVAKAYFKPSNRTIGVFTPVAKPDRAEIPATQDVQTLVKDYKGKVALANAETFDASTANIDARTKKGKLEGGAQYAFLSKTTRGSSVNVSVTLRVGTETALQNKGEIASLTASMLDRGTKSKTREQISDAFDKLKAGVNISGGGQTVRVSITATKENLPATLKLVGEVLRQASFPANEFDKLKDEELSGIEQQRNEPQSLAFNVFSHYMNQYAKNDFRYVQTYDEQAASVKAAKLEDVKQFYTDFYNSANATVAIVGDFDEGDALMQLQTALGGWSSPQKYVHAAEQYFEVPAKTEKVNTPDKKNAMFVAGLNLQLKDDDGDYAALTIGNYMLGGGFLNSRLAARIRQKEGLSYGVGSWIEGGQLDKVGSFGSYAIYNPDNADKLVTAYKEEIEKMLKDGFTDAELKDAKSGYLQDQKVNRAQDRALAGKLSSNLFLNRSMQWDEAMDKKIENIKVENISIAMKKFIHPEKITYVQAGDFKAAK